MTGPAALFLTARSTFPICPDGEHPMELSEHDLAAYLAANPEFFERHAELLTTVQLLSPHGNRAVSLQERQMEMLRDKMRTLEHRLAAMMRNAVDNETLAGKLLLWARDVMLAQQGAPEQLPQTLQDTLKSAFDLPMTALKLWPVREEFAALDFATGRAKTPRPSPPAWPRPSSAPTPASRPRTGCRTRKWRNRSRSFRCKTRTPACAWGCWYWPPRQPAFHRRYGH
jgi:Uncharacterized protein conserved in bacteria